MEARISEVELTLESLGSLLAKRHSGDEPVSDEAETVDPDTDSTPAEPTVDFLFSPGYRYGNRDYVRYELVVDGDSVSGAVPVHEAEAFVDRRLLLDRVRSLWQRVADRTDTSIKAAVVNHGTTFDEAYAEL